MKHVENIGALVDAAKPFLAAVPKDHPVAKIVNNYVSAEVAIAKVLPAKNHNFDLDANLSIVHGEELVEYYAQLSDMYDGCESKSVDTWDGCENE